MNSKNFSRNRIQIIHNEIFRKYFFENLLPIEIQADEQKIKQLVLILVDNAVKYTPDNGTVTVKLWQVNKARAAFS